MAKKAPAKKPVTKQAPAKPKAKKVGGLTQLGAQKLHEKGMSDAKIGKDYGMKEAAVKRLRRKGR